MHAQALLSCRASGRPPSGGGAAAPLQRLPWTRRKGRGPVGPESHAFPERTTHDRTLRKATPCARAACRTRGSSRPARHRFRSFVRNRRRSIGGALRSTRTLPTVRAPARTGNTAWPPTLPSRVHRGYRSLIVTRITKIGVIPEAGTASRTDGEAKGRACYRELITADCDDGAPGI